MSPEEVSDCEDQEVNKRRKVSELDQMGGINMDCLEIIFSYLDFVELVRVSRTCKMWYDVVEYFAKRQKKLVLERVFKPWKVIFRLSDKQFANVFKRTNLSQLDITPPDDTSKSSSIMPHGLLKAVVEHCPNLEKLDTIEVVWELKPALSLFAGLPNLTHLRLLSSSLTDPILSAILLNCKSLNYLDIGETQVTKDCFKNSSPNMIKALGIKANRNFPASWRDVGGILEDVHRLCPNLEKLDVTGHSFEYFEEVFQRGSFREDFPFDSLKYLNMGFMGDWNEDYELPVVKPVNCRMPNLKALDMTDNEDILLSEKFLPKLQVYCPKLTSLDISACHVSLFGSRHAGNCDLTQLLSLNKLLVLGLNSVKLDNGEVLAGAYLESCVQNISWHLKQLKVLEMSRYPDLNNEHVVELIIGLPNLKELVIEDCPKVDNKLFSMLTAHPDFVEKKQFLNIRVCGTGITQEVTVPDIIDLYFTTYHYGHGFGISKTLINFDESKTNGIDIFFSGCDEKMCF